MTKTWTDSVKIAKNYFIVNLVVLCNLNRTNNKYAQCASPMSAPHEYCRSLRMLSCSEGIMRVATESRIEAYWYRCTKILYLTTVSTVTVRNCSSVILSPTGRHNI